MHNIERMRRQWELTDAAVAAFHQLKEEGRLQHLPAGTLSMEMISALVLAARVEELEATLAALGNGADR